MLRRTTQEEVELVLLNSPEFSKSDKKKGIYHYHEIASAAIEIPAEEAAAAYESEEAATAEMPAELPDEVEFIDEVGEIEFEQVAPPPALVPEKPRPAPAAPAPAPPPLPPVPGKKEKPHKKKKGKLESEKTVGARKSERRVIEERIVEEESAEEALLAEKAAQDEELDFAPLPDILAPEAEPEAEAPAAAAEEAAEEEAVEAEAETVEASPEPAKPAAPGGLFGNLFAEKLKSALVKKRAEDAQKKPEDEAPES